VRLHKNKLAALAKVCYLIDKTSRNAIDIFRTQNRPYRE
jgi:hypothetical protein